VNWSETIHPLTLEERKDTMTEDTRYIAPPSMTYEQAKEKYEEAREAYRVALKELDGASRDTEIARDTMCRAHAAFVVILNQQVNEEP